MTTEPQPADLLAPLLALVAKWRAQSAANRVKPFRTSEECAMCLAADEHADELSAALSAQRSEDNGNLTLLDRVEFALRDAGFDYDEAFRCAYLAEYGIDPRSHPAQAQAGAGDDMFDLIAANRHAAWLEGYDKARVGQHLVYGGVEHGDFDSAVCRMEYDSDSGDASVGMQGWSGWVLSEDQRGTLFDALYQYSQLNPDGWDKFYDCYLQTTTPALEASQ